MNTQIITRIHLRNIRADFYRYIDNMLTQINELNVTEITEDIDYDLI